MAASKKKKTVTNRQIFKKTNIHIIFWQWIEPIKLVLIGIPTSRADVVFFKTVCLPTILWHFSLLHAPLSSISQLFPSFFIFVTEHHSSCFISPTSLKLRANVVNWLASLPTRCRTQTSSL